MQGEEEGLRAQPQRLPPPDSSLEPFQLTIAAPPTRAQLAVPPPISADTPVGDGTSKPFGDFYAKASDAGLGPRRRPVAAAGKPPPRVRHVPLQAAVPAMSTLSAHPQPHPIRRPVAGDGIAWSPDPHASSRVWAAASKPQPNSSFAPFAELVSSKPSFALPPASQATPYSSFPSFVGDGAQTSSSFGSTSSFAPFAQLAPPSTRVAGAAAHAETSYSRTTPSSASLDGFRLDWEASESGINDGSSSPAVADQVPSRETSSAKQGVRKQVPPKKLTKRRASLELDVSVTSVSKIRSADGRSAPAANGGSFARAEAKKATYAGNRVSVSSCTSSEAGSTARAEGRAVSVELTSAAAAEQISLPPACQGPVDGDGPAHQSDGSSSSLTTIETSSDGEYTPRGKSAPVRPPRPAARARAAARTKTNSDSHSDPSELDPINGDYSEEKEVDIEAESDLLDSDAEVELGPVNEASGILESGSVLAPRSTFRKRPRTSTPRVWPTDPPEVHPASVAHTSASAANVVRNGSRNAVNGAGQPRKSPGLPPSVLTAGTARSPTKSRPAARRSVPPDLGGAAKLRGRSTAVAWEQALDHVLPEAVQTPDAVPDAPLTGPSGVAAESRLAEAKAGENRPCIPPRLRKLTDEVAHRQLRLHASEPIVRLLRPGRERPDPTRPADRFEMSGMHHKAKPLRVRLRRR